ncbi:MAG TPA: acyl-CoA dehydrogenase family protein [Solirubrobacterales bacterium]
MAESPTPVSALADERALEALLDQRERELRDAVREVVRREVAPRALGVDAESAFPEQGFKALADAELAGLLVPAEFGGQGASTLAYALAVEEIASACGSTSTVYMTQMHCAYPILLHGTDEQRQRFLPDLAAGRIYGAIAVTEPEVGSDAAAMKTRAERTGDEYRIDGTKTFITSGDRAGVIVVWATLDPGAGRDGITAFLVEGDRPGLATGAVLEKLGMKGSSTAELFFEDCRVPLANRLGEEREGYALTVRSVVKSRISAAAQGAGFARAAYERAAAWAHERGLLSGARRDAQDLQFAIADLRMRATAARGLLYLTARLVDDHSADPVAEVSAAKAFCTDTAVGVAERAVALLGEDGDRKDLELERILRDAKVTQIYDGTNQIQRLLIARDTRLRLEGRA